VTRSLATLALAVAALATVPVAAGAWPACVPRGTPIRVGAREVSHARSGRVETIVLRSRAMGDDEPVSILLPRHFDRSGQTRYPVLYLLHGAGGDHGSWLRDEHAADQLGDLSVITVMPDGTSHGLDGGYSDWFGLPPGAPGPPPAWETFHIRELIGFIDAHFPTRPGAGGRAIAGLSMGGGGATKYAAEHPGLFGYVGTFSGEADPLLPVAVAFQTQTCKWGDPATQAVVWRDNDSTTLAGNLRGVRVFVRSGTGMPGPLDGPTPAAGSGAAVVRNVQTIIEAGAHLENLDFVAALNAHHVRVDARFFPGIHAIPYWERDLRAFAGWLRVQLRHPPRAPARFTVRSAHAAFGAWGWQLRARRRVREFVYLTVGRDTITARGSGTLAVHTPARYRPATRHTVIVGGRRLAIRADRDGRLAFTLDLGPSHRTQQTAFGPSATAGWRTASARIVAAGRTPG
jgi:S-formylglutathione hydrolase FrmB